MKKLNAIQKCRIVHTVEKTLYFISGFITLNAILFYFSLESTYQYDHHFPKLFFPFLISVVVSIPILLLELSNRLTTKLWFHFFHS